MREIDVSDKNLDSIIFTLLAARANNEHVCCRFREHIFYSDTISFDSAYEMVYGMTRQEYDDRLQKMYEEHDELLRSEGIESNAADSIEIRRDLFRAAGIVYPTDEERKKRK